MRNKKPPFEITNTMIHEVADIAELVGKLTSTNQLSANPTLRRTNRIRTIHGSLAIEQNTLSLEQVTAVLNGKQVLAPPKDIAEVKNAYEIYEYHDPRIGGGVRCIPFPPCRCCRSRGTCPTFRNASAVCARFGNGAAGLD